MDSPPSSLKQAPLSVEKVCVPDGCALKARRHEPLPCGSTPSVVATYSCCGVGMNAVMYLAHITHVHSDSIGVRVQHPDLELYYLRSLLVAGVAQAHRMLDLFSPCPPTVPSRLSSDITTIYDDRTPANSHRDSQLLIDSERNSEDD